MSISVLFVCLGNICRSPTADGVLRKMVDDAGLSHVIEVDSAGTAGWHAGEPPDARTIATAATRGYDLSVLRARQVKQEDFRQFDYILAMDAQNHADLARIQPTDAKAHLGLFLDFGEQQKYREVPDPYYGKAKDFTLVLDLVEDAARGLLNAIRKNPKLSV